MTIQPFGWQNNAPPDVDAENLEAMHSAAGDYVDAETRRATTSEASIAAQARAQSLVFGMIF